ncbi:MAG: hypothetical protein J6U54_21795 [Clostridiales bacterium]|nr:hypothetical protein [Clostridiales bacterium]
MEQSTDSIFVSVKKHLGASEYDTGFDQDIINFINTQILRLYHLGVGNNPAFTISGPEETWDDFITDKSLQSTAREFIFLKVRRRFDPSASPTVDAAIQDAIAEDEFTLNIEAERSASGS